MPVGKMTYPHGYTLRKRPCNRRHSGAVQFFHPSPDSCLLTAGLSSQGRCIRICAGWYQSHKSYITPGGHRARVTSNDNCTMKNALFVFCEDRNCEWTNVIESVISSMNATSNWATGVHTLCDHWPSTQHWLAKIPHNEFTNQSPPPSIWHANQRSAEAIPSARRPVERWSRP